MSVRVSMSRMCTVCAAPLQDLFAATGAPARHLGVSVTAVDPGGMVLDAGQRIDAGTLIWTVGFRASGLIQRTPAPREALGRLQLDRRLKVEGMADRIDIAPRVYGQPKYVTCLDPGALGGFARQWRETEDAPPFSPRERHCASYSPAKHIGPTRQRSRERTYNETEPGGRRTALSRGSGPETRSRHLSSC